MATVPTLYRFEGCCLDLARGCLRVADRDVKLRPKSFDVLLHLVENAGRLVPKEEIISAVWPGVVVTDESVARCVSDARAAIGDRDQRIIRTVPRRGYLFTPNVSRQEFAEPERPRVGSAQLNQAPSDRPSIAVLAFVNMSGDPSQEYLSDGITEDIITELSRFSELTVIARNSSFKYKGRSVDVRRIGRELGVRYVLEGSIRRAGNRVRITAQLVDTTSAAHRWAERYDRDLTDVLAVQDEVARTVATILAAHVSNAEAQRALRKPPATWRAYDYYMRSAATLASLLSSFRAEELFEARRLAERSVSLDPDYARPNTILATTYIIAWQNPFDRTAFRPATLATAHRFASKAMRLDANLPQARAHLGNTLSWKREHEAALAEFAKAAALNPNFSDWRFALALLHASKPERALEVSRTYIRLDPFAPASASVWLGAAHYLLKGYSEALPHLREAVSRMPNARFAHNWLAATYAQLGELNLARAEAQEALRIDPSYTVEGSARVIFGFKSPDDTEHFCDGLRKAGIPER